MELCIGRKYCVLDVMMKTSPLYPCASTQPKLHPAESTAQGAAMATALHQELQLMLFIHRLMMCWKNAAALDGATAQG